VKTVQCSGDGDKNKAINTHPGGLTGESPHKLAETVPGAAHPLNQSTRAAKWAHSGQRKLLPYRGGSYEGAG